MSGKTSDTGGEARGSGGGWMVLLVILAIVGAIVLIPAAAALAVAVLHILVAIIGAILAAVVGLFAGLVGLGAVAFVVLLPVIVLLAIGFAIGRARRKGDAG
jgi:hypothetical protein